MRIPPSDHPNPYFNGSHDASGTPNEFRHEQERPGIHYTRTGDVMEVGDGVDGGVTYYRAIEAELETFTLARKQIEAMSVPFMHAKHDSHSRLFVAAFDGTGADGDIAIDDRSNVAEIAEQYRYHQLKDPDVTMRYIEGPGTQNGFLTSTHDMITGGSYEDRLNRMHDELQAKAQRWYDEDPHIRISVINLGFSRGAEQAAGFARLIHDKGIFVTDPGTGQPINLVEGKHIIQAVGLFDPVGTGEPHTHDRSLPPSVVAGLQLRAKDEKRDQFRDTAIIPRHEPGTPFQMVEVPGSHSDVGGGYKIHGLSVRSGNLMRRFLSALTDAELNALPEAEPESPSNVIHRSEEGSYFYTTTAFDETQTRASVPNAIVGGLFQSDTPAPPIEPWSGRTWQLPYRLVGASSEAIPGYTGDRIGASMDHKRHTRPATPYGNTSQGERRARTNNGQHESAAGGMSVAELTTLTGQNTARGTADFLRHSQGRVRRDISVLQHDSAPDRSVLDATSARAQVVQAQPRSQEAQSSALMRTGSLRKFAGANGGPAELPHTLATLRGIGNSDSSMKLSEESSNRLDVEHSSAPSSARPGSSRRKRAADNDYSVGGKPMESVYQEILSEQDVHKLQNITARDMLLNYFNYKNNVQLSNFVMEMNRRRMLNKVSQVYLKYGTTIFDYDTFLKALFKDNEHDSEIAQWAERATGIDRSKLDADHLLYLLNKFALDIKDDIAPLTPLPDSIDKDKFDDFRRNFIDEANRPAVRSNINRSQYKNHFDFIVSIMLASMEQSHTPQTDYYLQPIDDKKPYELGLDHHTGGNNDTTSAGKPDEQPSNNDGYLTFVEKSDPAHLAAPFDSRDQVYEGGFFKYLSNRLAPSGTDPRLQKNLNEKYWAWLTSSSAAAELLASLSYTANNHPNGGKLELGKDLFLSSSRHALVKKIVTHLLALPNEIDLQEKIKSASTGTVPVFSLAVQLQQLKPALTPQEAFVFAAVLVPQQTGAAVFESSGPILLEHMPGLDEFGIDLIDDDIDNVDFFDGKDLRQTMVTFGLDILCNQKGELEGSAADSWQFITRSNQCEKVTRRLLREAGWISEAQASPLGAQAIVGYALLRQYVGQKELDKIQDLLHPANAAKRSPHQVNKDISEILTKANPQAGSADLAILRYLVANKFGAPELLINIPEWVTYRSLTFATFLQGVELAEALAPGASSSLSFETALKLPSRFATIEDDAVKKLLAASMMRAAIYYAVANDAVTITGTPKKIDRSTAKKAVEYLINRQARRAYTASGLVAKLPDQVELAKSLLRSHHIGEFWWSHSYPLEYMSKRYGISGLSYSASGFDLTAGENEEADTSLLNRVRYGSILVGGVDIDALYKKRWIEYQNGFTSSYAALVAQLASELPEKTQALLGQSSLALYKSKSGNKHGGERFLIQAIKRDGGDGTSSDLWLEVTPSLGIIRETEAPADQALYEKRVISAVGSLTAPDAMAQQAANLMTEDLFSQRHDMHFAAHDVPKLMMASDASITRRSAYNAAEGARRSEKASIDAISRFAFRFYQAGGVLSSTTKVSHGDHGLTLKALAKGLVKEMPAMVASATERAGPSAGRLLTGDSWPVNAAPREISEVTTEAIKRELGGLTGAGVLAHAFEQRMEARPGARPGLPARAWEGPGTWPYQRNDLTIGDLDSQTDLLAVKTKGGIYAFDPNTSLPYGPKLPNARLLNVEFKAFPVAGRDYSGMPLRGVVHHPGVKLTVSPDGKLGALIGRDKYVLAGGGAGTTLLREKASARQEVERVEVETGGHSRRRRDIGADLAGTWSGQPLYKAKSDTARHDRLDHKANNPIALPKQGEFSSTENFAPWLSEVLSTVMSNSTSTVPGKRPKPGEERSVVLRGKQLQIPASERNDYLANPPVNVDDRTFVVDAENSRPATYRDEFNVNIQHRTGIFSFGELVNPVDGLDGSLFTGLVVVPAKDTDNANRNYVVTALEEINSDGSIQLKYYYGTLDSEPSGLTTVRMSTELSVGNDSESVMTDLRHLHERSTRANNLAAQYGPDALHKLLDKLKTELRARMGDQYPEGQLERTFKHIKTTTTLEQQIVFDDALVRDVVDAYGKDGLAEYFDHHLRRYSKMPNTLRNTEWDNVLRNLHKDGLNLVSLNEDVEKAVTRAINDPERTTISIIEDDGFNAKLDRIGIKMLDPSVSDGSITHQKLRFLMYLKISEDREKIGGTTRTEQEIATNLADDYAKKGASQARIDAALAYAVWSTDENELSLALRDRSMSHLIELRKNQIIRYFNAQDSNRGNGRESDGMHRIAEAEGREGAVAVGRLTDERFHNLTFYGENQGMREDLYKAPGTFNTQYREPDASDRLYTGKRPPEIQTYKPTPLPGKNNSMAQSHAEQHMLNQFNSVVEKLAKIEKIARERNIQKDKVTEDQIKDVVLTDPEKKLFKAQIRGEFNVIVDHPHGVCVHCRAGLAGESEVSATTQEGSIAKFSKDYTNLQINFLTRSSAKEPRDGRRFSVRNGKKMPAPESAFRNSARTFDLRSYIVDPKISTKLKSMGANADGLYILADEKGSNKKTYCAYDGEYYEVTTQGDKYYITHPVGRLMRSRYEIGRLNDGTWRLNDGPGWGGSSVGFESVPRQTRGSHGEIIALGKSGDNEWNALKKQYGLSASWLPELSSIEKRGDGSYTMEVVNFDGTQRKTLTLKSSSALAKIALRSAAAVRAVDKAFAPKAGQLTLRPGATHHDVVHAFAELDGINTLSAGFMILGLQGGNDERLSPELASAVKAQFYLQLVQTVFGSVNDVRKLADAIYHELNLVTGTGTAAISLVDQAGTPIAIGTMSASLGKLLEAGNKLLTMANLALDIYLLAHAETDAQRVIYGMNLGFDTAAAGLELAAMITGSEVLGPLGVPLAGLGFGITSLVGEVLAKGERLATVWETFNEELEAYRNGYAEDPATHAWSLRGQAVVTHLNLRPTGVEVEFGDPAVYGVDSSKPGVPVPDWNKLIDIRRTLNLSNLPPQSLSPTVTSVHLPGTPLHTKRPVFTQLPGSSTRHDAELRGVEELERASKGDFIFRKFSLGEHILEKFVNEYKPTNIKVSLAPKALPLVIDDLNERGQYLTYDIEGQGGAYQIHLNDGPKISLSTQEASKGSTWVLHTNNLISPDDIQVQNGQLRIGDVTVKAGDLEKIFVVNQSGETFKVDMIKAQITLLAMSAGNYDSVDKLQAHLKMRKGQGRLSDSVQIQDLSLPSMPGRGIAYRSSDESFVAIPMDGLNHGSEPYQFFVEDRGDLVIAPSPQRRDVMRAASKWVKLDTLLYLRRQEAGQDLKTFWNMSNPYSETLYSQYMRARYRLDFQRTLLQKARADQADRVFSDKALSMMEQLLPEGERKLSAKGKRQVSVHRLSVGRAEPLVGTTPYASFDVLVLGDKDDSPMALYIPGGDPALYELNGVWELKSLVARLAADHSTLRSLQAHFPKPNRTSGFWHRGTDEVLEGVGDGHLDLTYIHVDQFKIDDDDVFDRLASIRRVAESSW